MKRTFALILVFALCASLALAACSKLKKSDVEKDVAAAVADAISLTSKGLCDRIPAYKALSAAKDGGVVTFKLDSADLGIVLEGRSAYDTASRRISGAYSLSAGSEKVTFGLESANNKLAVTSPELFEGAYGADLSTVNSELRESVVAKSVTTLTGVDVVGLADSIVPIMRLFTVEDSAMIHAAFEKIKGDVKNCLSNASHTVEEKKITVGDESVKVYEVTFTLTKKDVSDLLGAVKSEAGLFGGGLAQLSAFAPQSADGALGFDTLSDAIDDALAELAKDGNDANAVIVFDISPKSGELLCVSASGELKNGENSEALDFSLILGAEPTASDNAEGSLTMTSVKDGKTTVCGATFSLERSDSDKEFARKLTVDTVTTAGGESDSHKTVIDFRNDREAKTYTCAIDTDFDHFSGETGGASVSKLTFGGTLDCTDTTFTMTVGKVTASQDGGDTSEIADLGLSLSVAPGEAIGAMPEYKNIAALDFEQVTDLWQEISGNREKLSAIANKIAELKALFGLTAVDDKSTDLGEGADPGEDGGTDAGDYLPDDVLSLYDDFDEQFDYNVDGKLDEGDRAEWEEYYRPYGEEFDEDYDYDLDGEKNTPADRDAYESTRRNISGETGETFNSIYAQFNEQHDYDGDGAVGTDADRADYEQYYKPFAEEFDPSRDYDQDGEANGDDRDWYDYIRSK